MASHPLSQIEYGQAISIAKQDWIFVKTINLLERGILDYIETIKKDPVVSHTISPNSVSTWEYAASIGSFMLELLPIIALAWDKNRKIEENFSTGLAAAFKKQAFIAGKWIEDGNKRKPEKICDFAKTIVHMFNINLIALPNNLIAIDNPSPGALPGFIYTKLTEQADKAPALRVG